jgi:hypothetical protein
VEGDEPNTKRIVLVQVTPVRANEPEAWLRGWEAGPLVIDEHDWPLLSRRFVELISNTESYVRRWHLDLLDSPSVAGDPEVLGIDALHLEGLPDWTYLLAFHFALRAAFSANVWQSSREATERLPTVLKRSMGPNAQLLSSRPLAELICIPTVQQTPKSDWSVSGTETLLPEHFAMHVLANPEVDRTAESAKAGVQGVFRLPYGFNEMLVGRRYAIAVGGDIWDRRAATDEALQRTTVLNALLYAVAQRVFLEHLADQAARLAEPRRDPSRALAISRGSTTYRAIYSWQRTGDDALDHIVADYRRAHDIDALAQQLDSFERAAQTALTAETNLLLAMVAVVGLAVTFALAVVAAAGWNGWTAGWGIPIAFAAALVILATPPARSLRQQIASVIHRAN